MKRLFNLFLLIILIIPSTIQSIDTRIMSKNQKTTFGNHIALRKRREKRVVNIHNLTSLVYYKNMTNFPYLINFNLTLQNKNGYMDYRPHKLFYKNPNEFLLNSSQKLLATIDQALNTFFKQHMASQVKNVTRPKVKTSSNITTLEDSKNASTEADYFETDFNSTFSMYDDPEGISMDYTDNASFSWYDDLQANLSSAFDEEHQPPNPYGSYTMGQYVIIIILTVLLSTITILGNLLVLFSFVIERTLRQATNYYIVSLAVSDLIIGMISMPFYTLYLLLGSWPLGELLCDLWLSIDYTVCLASQYTVFFITLDRYCSVKIPASYRQWRTAFKVKFMIYCAWGIPIGIFFSAIIGWQYIFKSRGIEPDQCYVPFRDNRVFNTSLIFFYYWSTLVVLVSLYAGIYKVAYDLSRKSIEKEKRARAIVEHAILNRTEMKKTGKDLKAETIKVGEKANTLSILKHRKEFPDETTSFSRDTKEKEKSSSVSFPSDTDSQNDNSYAEIPHKKDSKIKNAAKQKSKEDNKNIDKKKVKALSPKLKHNNKNQYALNHLEPIKLLAPQSLEKLQKNEDNDKNATVFKDGQDSEEDHVNNDMTTENIESVSANKDTEREEDKNVNDTFQFDEDKEEQLNKILTSVKSFNIRITTNTPAIPDGDDFLEEDSEIFSANDVPLISKKASNEIDSNFDRKNLVLKGLKEGQSFKALNNTGKGNLTSSFSFQSTATTLTPLTPYPDDVNTTKESFVSSSLLPSTADKSYTKIEDSQTDGKNGGKKSQNDQISQIKKSSNGNNKRHSSLISNIVSFGKRSSKDKNKYNLGSASAGDEEYKGKQDAVMSGDKSSSDSKGNKTRHGGGGKRRKSLSIIIKFKKKRKPNSERKKSKSENRARKALRTITCIMGAFVLCWTPYHICETIRGFNPDFPLNEHFYSFTYWLCYLNSPLNPLMYALANQQFKKTFIRIFKCDLHKN